MADIINATYTVNIDKAGRDITIDFGDMPEKSQIYIIEYGLKQSLNDAAAVVSKADHLRPAFYVDMEMQHGLEKGEFRKINKRTGELSFDEASYFARVKALGIDLEPYVNYDAFRESVAAQAEKRLAALRYGTFKELRGTRVPSDPVRAKAEEIAFGNIAALMRENGMFALSVEEVRRSTSATAKEIRDRIKGAVGGYLARKPETFDVARKLVEEERAMRSAAVSADADLLAELGI